MSMVNLSVLSEELEVDLPSSARAPNKMEIVAWLWKACQISLLLHGFHYLIEYDQLRDPPDAAAIQGQQINGLILTRGRHRQQTILLSHGNIRLKQNHARYIRQR